MSGFFRNIGIIKEFHSFMGNDDGEREVFSPGDVFFWVEHNKYIQALEVLDDRAPIFYCNECPFSSMSRCYGPRCKDVHFKEINI